MGAMEIQNDSAADQAILAALREGNSRQAAKLMAHYYGGSVFNVCRSLVVDPDQAEDLTQASFSRAFSSLDSIRIQGQVSPRVWLMNVAQECCATYLRQEVCPEDVDVAIPDPQVVGNQSSWKISESLERRLEILASAL